MTGVELNADHAWDTIRSCRHTFYVKAFARFRYAYGFSHSRALGLQLSLAFVPLVIALIGLSSALHVEGIGEVIRLTLLSLTPGRSDGVIAAILPAPASGGDVDQAAFWLRLLAAVVALTTFEQRPCLGLVEDLGAGVGSANSTSTYLRWSQTK